jgi:4-hydroxy-tetrahydrodipicolinate synthase
MKGYGTVIPALVTPFDQRGRVDEELAASLAEHLVELGCDGVLVGGTTAESPTLSDEEKMGLVRAVARRVGDRVFVWAGTGTNDTEHTLELTRRAVAEGADGVMLVCPYYNRPPQEGLFRHFYRAAEAAGVPVMLYNIPGRTGVNLLPETVARLAREVENIVAIKEASGNLDQISTLRRLTPREFIVYSGDDSLTLPPYREGRVEEARELHLQMLPLFKALFVTTNPIPVKYALRLMGFEVGDCRPPLLPPSPAEQAAVREGLQAVGLLPVSA